VLDQTIGKSGFAVINVGDDAEITYMLVLHCVRNYLKNVKRKLRAAKTAEVYS
jgi:hypothetical protein